MKQKYLNNKTSKNQTMRLNNCIKAQMEILTRREALVSSQDYRSWCSSNKVPYIRVEQGRKYSYVSMDLPNVRGASAFPKYLEICKSLCDKYGVELTGCFSVLEVPNNDAITFSKELFQIGVSLYAEHNANK
jgi:hypothetical protein